MGRVALIVLLIALAAAPAAHGSTPRSRAMVEALTALDERLAGKGSLSAAARAAVHDEKSALAEFFEGDERTVLVSLDCTQSYVQRARNSRRRAAQLRLLRTAATCLKAVPGGPASLRRSLAAITARARAGRVFGALATSLRKASLAWVKAEHAARTEGVSFAAAYENYECIDVKVEAGRTSGASACARRLRRLVEDNAPTTAPVTFGSDLSGDPVAISGVYPEDTEFWTQGVTVPEAGMLTEFRLRTGSGPVELPLRFSVVRPQPSGQVLVITTTDPPFTLAAGTPGVHRFSTSALSFKCCRVQKGDIVTVNNRGAGQTRDPYVWFARKPGFTTLSHTCSPCGRSMDPGNLWTGTPHEGYEVLLQVTLQPD